MSIPYKALIVDTPDNALTSKQREAAKRKLGEKVEATRQQEAVRHPTYKVPDSIAGWWGNVDEWWDELDELLQSFVRPKAVLVMAIDLGIQPANLSVHAILTQVAVRLKHDRDKRLHDLFEAAWSGAPDNGSIHALAGWHVLCDLCSESYVLYEDGPDGEVLMKEILERAPATGADPEGFK